MKSCLVPHIMKHVEEEGFLPALLSPCTYAPGDHYWSWVNRYEGDLVVVDLDAPEYPHLNTKWKVSVYFPAIKWCVRLTILRNTRFIFH
jgi:hypothetical protein